MKLPYDDSSFDICSIAFGIRNVDDAEVSLREMARVVKPGGRVVVLEFGQPKGLMKFPFKAYSKYFIPTIGGLMSGNREAYQYLPETSAAFPSGDQFTDLMMGTGSFTEARAHSLQSGIAYIYIGKVA